MARACTCDYNIILAPAVPKTAPQRPTRTVVPQVTVAQQVQVAMLVASCRSGFRWRGWWRAAAGSGGGEVGAGYGWTNGDHVRRGHPALAESAAGEFAPATRFSSVAIPAGQGRCGRCRRLQQIVGANNGSGLTGLLQLLAIDNLDEFFAADAEDPVHLLGHMSGWAAGQTGGEVENPILKIYLGESNGDIMSISPDSPNADGRCVGSVPSQYRERLVSTEAGPFSFTLPFEGVIINLNLEATQIVGKVNVADTGIGMTDTNISGYLTRDAIIALIESIKTLCESERHLHFAMT